MSKQLVPILDVVANEVDEFIQSKMKEHNISAELMLVIMQKATENLYRQKDYNYSALILSMEKHIDDLENMITTKVSEEMEREQAEG